MNLPRSLADITRGLASMACLLAGIAAASAQYNVVVLQGPNSYGYGAAVGTQVGVANSHAKLWHGNPGGVDIHPVGYVDSYAVGTSTDSQVGTADLDTTGMHHPHLGGQASLWS